MLGPTVDMEVIDVVTNVPGLIAFNITNARSLTMTNITTYHANSTLVTSCLHLQIDGMFSNDVPVISSDYDVVHVIGYNDSSTATLTNVEIRYSEPEHDAGSISCIGVCM